MNRFAYIALSTLILAALLHTSGRDGTSSPPTAKYDVLDLSTWNFHTQVANSSHRKERTWDPIRLGLASNIRVVENIGWIFDLLLFGSLVTMGVHLFGLCMLRKGNLPTLYFAIFTTVIALRILICGNFSLTLMFPDIPWELLIKLERLSATLPLPFLLLFITSLFSSQEIKKVLSCLIGIGSLFSLIILLVPSRLSSYLIVPNQGLILLGFGYILIVMVKAFQASEKGAGVILIGVNFFAGTVIVDILNANQVYHTIGFVPLGLLCLIFSHSFVLSSRVAGAFQEAKNLSGELKEENGALLGVVRETMEENRALKHEVRRCKQRERALKKVLARLSRILDTVGDAIVAVNQNRKIAFCNHHCKTLLGYSPKALLGKPVHGFVPMEYRDKVDRVVKQMLKKTTRPPGEKTTEKIPLCHSTRRTITCHLEVIPLQVGEERILVLTMHEKIRQPKAAVAESCAPRKDDGLRLAPIEKALPPPENGMEKKKLGVHAMNLAMAYWFESTATSKIDLARRSNLWAVHTNQNGFERTQTLDKYLDINRLPQRPRWNQIYQTLAFVLDASKAPSPLREELEHSLTALRLIK